MVDNRNDPNKTINCAIKEVSPTKRKRSEINSESVTKSQEEQENDAKRARVTPIEVENFDSALVTTSELLELHHNLANNNYFNFQFFDPTEKILYASKKTIGTKLKAENEIFEKIKQIGLPLEDGTIFQPRTVYWLYISQPNCSLHIMSSKQKSLDIEETYRHQDFTLFQIRTPKQEGRHALAFNSAGSRTAIAVVVSSSDNLSKCADANENPIPFVNINIEPTASLMYNNQFGDNTQATILQAMIVSFCKDQFDTLRSVLERLEFTKHVESRACQLWSRHTEYHWNVLIYPTFGMENLFSFKERLSLVDGVLLILPQQNERSYEVSDIEISDGNKLPLSTTIGLSESVHTTTLPPSAQAVVALLKKERSTSYEVSAVHQSSPDYLASYIPSWLTIGLKARSTPQNLYLCFKYEKTVKALTEYAQLTFAALGVNVELE